MVAHADGSQPVVIAPQAQAMRHVTWSPDGRTLATSFWTADVTTFQRDRIFLAPSDGSAEPTRIDPDFSAFYPTYSPDGTRIAFISDLSPDRCTDADCQGDKSYALYVMGADGTGVTQLVHGAVQPALDLDRWTRLIDWSPDGSHILFSGVALDDPESRSIYSVAVSGGAPERVETGDGRAFGASFSPDGRRIAYVRSSTNGTWEAVVADADGRNAKPIRSDVERFAPQWSPDGRFVAVFDAVRTTDATIEIMPVDGHGEIVTLHAFAPRADPAQLGIDLVGWQRTG